MYIVCAVSEIKYEKIPAQMDGDTFDASKEFRFTIPANSDFFTRYNHSKTTNKKHM
jgi:hypothetical protein